MSGIATAVIGGAVISAVAGGKAASKASKAQQAGIDTATGEQRRQFDITTEQLANAQRANRLGLQQGSDLAVGSLEQGRERQFEQLDPFSQAGVGALQQQQALLGLGDQQQQQDAFNQFADSPGQRFIRERAQKALVRNAAAIGGLGGGNVRAALVEQGAGFAAQDFSNQFNRLSDLRTAGQNAATNIGQGALTTGGNIASTQFNTAQLQGAGAINTAARQGQFGQNFASNVGNLAVQGGNTRATGIQNQSNILQNTIGQVAGAAGQFFGGTPPPGSFNQVGGQSPNTFTQFNPLGGN